MSSQAALSRRRLSVTEANFHGKNGDLSEMVGTTRPRISLFYERFHNLGLIDANRDRFLIIKEKKLTDYLAQIA